MLFWKSEKQVSDLSPQRKTRHIENVDVDFSMGCSAQEFSHSLALHLPAGASRLQSLRPVRRVAELGSLGCVRMVTPAKVIFAVVCGFLAGGVFFLKAIDWFAVRNAPVVTGRVASREATSWLSIPRVDFTIKIDGTETLVHARTQRGMMTKVPDIVRFHYTGDPNRNVILYEQEMHPGWLVLLFWGAALVLALSMRSAYIREVLGWGKKSADEHAA